MGETTIRRNAGPLTKIIFSKLTKWTAARAIHKLYKACNEFDMAFTNFRTLSTRPEFFDITNLAINHEAASLVDIIDRTVNKLYPLKALDEELAIKLRDIKSAAINALAILSAKSISINAKIIKLKEYNQKIQNLKKEIIY